jgi:hypothetical protein
MRSNFLSFLANVSAAAVWSMASLHGAFAKEGDMMVGTWGTMFCGAPATFEVLSKKADWVFEGKVLIRDTKEYDRIEIKQYEDNHLRIIRYLTGSNSGNKQIVTTNQPKMLKQEGRTSAAFASYHPGKGVGCNNSGAVTVLTVYY